MKWDLGSLQPPARPHPRGVWWAGGLGDLTWLLPCRELTHREGAPWLSLRGRPCPRPRHTPGWGGAAEAQHWGHTHSQLSREALEVGPTDPRLWPLHGLGPPVSCRLSRWLPDSEAPSEQELSMLHPRAAPRLTARAQLPSDGVSRAAQGREGRGTPWKEPGCSEDGSVASVPGSHSGLLTEASPGQLSLPGPGRHAGGFGLLSLSWSQSSDNVACPVGLSGDHPPISPVLRALLPHRC